MLQIADEDNVDGGLQIREVTAEDPHFEMRRRIRLPEGSFAVLSTSAADETDVFLSCHEGDTLADGAPRSSTPKRRGGQNPLTPPGSSTIRVKLEARNHPLGASVFGRTRLTSPLPATAGGLNSDEDEPEKGERNKPSMGASPSLGGGSIS